MPQIIPIRDLKNTSEISQMCHASNELIFVTKNGYGDMVIMSMKMYGYQRTHTIIICDSKYFHLNKFCDILCTSIFKFEVRLYHCCIFCTRILFPMFCVYLCKKTKICIDNCLPL